MDHPLTLRPTARRGAALACLPAAGLLAAGLLLPACSSGGGGPAGNLRVVATRILPVNPSNTSVDPNAAHEMTVVTTIEATAAFTNVPVDFIVLELNDVDQEREEVRQHQLSTAVFEQVAAGTAEYEAVVSIPRECEESPVWYLIADLDPKNVIAETDEEDNQPTEPGRLGADIGSQNTNVSDIVLDTATPDEDAVILYGLNTVAPVGSITDEFNHDFGVTIEASSTGWRELVDVDLQADIIVPGFGRFPIRFWDEVQSLYHNRLLTTITPGITNTIECDMLIPGGNARNAVQTVVGTNGPSTFTVEFHANRASNYAQWDWGSQRHNERSTGDDTIAVEIVVMLPPPTSNTCNDILWDTGYKKDWTNRYFGVGLDFGTSSTLDGDGATAEGHARVPVKLFGRASNALDMTALANVKPNEGAPTDSLFTFDFSMFGVSVYSERSQDPSYTFEESQSLVKSYEQRGVIFVGPIPINLRSVATGTLGWRTTAFLDPARMELQAVAFANLTALAEASVNAVVASGGVAGTMTIISDEFTSTATAQLGTPAGGRLTGTLEFDVTNVLRGPEGRIYLFEQHTVPKWCHKVIPCGLRTVRNEKTLVRFRTFRKTDVLFNDTRTATVCF